MGYKFTIGKHYRVKSDAEYPWPCAALPKRRMMIFRDDVLTLREDGTYMKHTGLGTFGHVIPPEDVEEHSEPVNLRLL